MNSGAGRGRSPAPSSICGQVFDLTHEMPPPTLVYQIPLGRGNHLKALLSDMASRLTHRRCHSEPKFQLYCGTKWPLKRLQKPMAQLE